MKKLILLVLALIVVAQCVLAQTAGAGGSGGAGGGGGSVIGGSGTAGAGGSGGAGGGGGSVIGGGGTVPCNFGNPSSGSIQSSTNCITGTIPCSGGGGGGTAGAGGSGGAGGGGGSVIGGSGTAGAGGSGGAGGGGGSVIGGGGGGSCIGCVVPTGNNWVLVCNFPVNNAVAGIFISKVEVYKRVVNNQIDTRYLIYYNPPLVTCCSIPCPTGGPFTGTAGAGGSGGAGGGGGSVIGGSGTAGAGGSGGAGGGGGNVIGGGTNPCCSVPCSPKAAIHVTLTDASGAQFDLGYHSVLGNPNNPIEVIRTNSNYLPCGRVVINGWSWCTTQGCPLTGTSGSNLC